MPHIFLCLNNERVVQAVTKEFVTSNSQQDKSEEGQLEVQIFVSFFEGNKQISKLYLNITVGAVYCLFSCG